MEYVEGETLTDKFQSGRLSLKQVLQIAGEVLMSSEGGPWHRITLDSTEEGIPSFSRDGRWIYFGSNRRGSWQIWKMPSEGGKAIQITRDGGMAARESTDGHFVYYSDDYNIQKKGIWRVPVAGGPETLVVDRGVDHWDLTEQGIYFIDGNTNPVPTICFYDFAATRVKNVAPVHVDPKFALQDGFSVSPDGKWLLYTGGISTSDIMLIDNFR